MAWLVPETTTQTLAVAGILAYGLTYLGCVLFYGPFGIEPADVGLGYADVLAQAAVFVVLLFVGGLLVAGAVVLVARAFGAEWEKRVRGGKGLTPRGVLITRTLGAVVVVAVVLVPVLVGALLDSARAQRGEAVSGTAFIDFGVDLLPWSDAEVANVTWTGTGKPPALPDCVIRLGEAANVEVVYDPVADETLRLPQASVTVRIRPNAKPCPSG
jgi:hypothetical protein